MVRHILTAWNAVEEQTLSSIRVESMPPVLSKMLGTVRMLERS
jgi:hypothetical protein